MFSKMPLIHVSIRACQLVLVLCLVLLLFPTTRGLADYWNDEFADISDIEPLKKGIDDYYRLFANISAACGAVSFAIGAFRMMLASDDKGIAQGKQQMKFTLLAVIAIQVLPLFLHWGYSFMRDVKPWDPMNP